tara:strand:+ start:319 stop:708 length:390 start_codon:yes stop_codon:yes gene_type:complete
MATNENAQRDYLLNPNLKAKITNIEREIINIKGTLDNLERLFGNSPNQAQFKKLEQELNVSIRSNSSRITKIEEKLSKISLPADTRFYLEESEVRDFRANFQKLTALMTDVENLYDTMVAYLSNATENT